MTSNDAESTAETTNEGVQQIPAQITVTEVPAMTEARDALLAAIGAEAQLVADKSAGQASAALVELARAYALVGTGGSAGSLAMARNSGLCLYPEVGDEVMLGFFGENPRSPVIVGARSQLRAAEQLTDSPDQASSVVADEGIQQIPAQIQVQASPAATAARDKIVAAVGAEAEAAVEKSAGQTSAMLAELARAYALVSAPLSGRGLPSRFPQWTDHNVSDPGVTLIEAAAERGDLLAYRGGSVTAEGLVDRESEAAATPDGEGTQQIQIQQPPAVTDARDKLLAAIGAEAQLVAEKSAGQASAALVELARAYALVVSGPTAVVRDAATGESRRVIYAATVLSDPTLQEPMYLVDVQAPTD